MPELHEEKVVARLLRDIEVGDRLKFSGLDHRAFTETTLKGIVKVSVDHAKKYGEPITFDSFKIAISGNGIDPTPYLAAFQSLLQTSCTPGELEVSLKELKRRRIINSISGVLETTIDEIQGKKTPAEEIAKNLRQRALDVGRESRISYASEGSIRDSLDERVELLEQKIENPEAFTGSLTGWGKFNEATNGIMRGETAVVVAEPGGGKTTWMIAVSEQVYSEKGANVVYFSHEMPRKQLEYRYDTRIAVRLDPETSLTYRKIRDGRMTSDEFQTYKTVIDFHRSKRNQLYIVDDPSLDVEGIRERLERLRSEMEIDLVIVDYLGIIPGAAGGWESIARVLGEIYTLGREMNVPIVTAAQKNPQGQIGLSYLIKAHASMIIRINQDESMRLVGEIEQEFLKNREGSTPRFPCRTDFDRMLIEEIVQRREDESI